MDEWSIVLGLAATVVPTAAVIITAPALQNRLPDRTERWGLGDADHGRTAVRRRRARPPFFRHVDRS